MAKTPDKQTTVVAELQVTSATTDETIKSFDLAWHRALSIAEAEPFVSIRFLGFVRKD